MTESDTASAAGTVAMTAIYAGVVGKLDEFDPKNDSMAAYVERAMLYLDANSVPEDKRAATFLSALGKSTFLVLRNLIAPAKVQDKTLDEIVQVLLKHYDPKPLVISERFNFNRRQQEPNESVADYVAELRRLTEHCEFGNFLDDALRDKFVCGLRSEATQKKLLVETRLTFARAVEIAQSMESAASKTKQLQSHSSGGAANQAIVNKLTPSQSDVSSNSCYRCNRTNHPPTHCPFKSAKCHHCGKVGHIQSACKSKQPRNNPQFKRGAGRHSNSRRGGRGRGRTVQLVQEETEDFSDFLNHIDVLNQVSTKTHQPYLVDLELDGKSLVMEVDTGACMSLVSEQTFNQLFPQKALKPTNTRLSTYSGQPITALGEIEVVVTYQAQQVKLPLMVVTGTGPSLLGRNWLSTIRLNWKAIGSISSYTSLTRLLEKYSTVFKSGLGKLIGHEAKLQVDPGAQPRFCKARTIPYAMKRKVEAELERLQKEGIIQPVQYADWAAPIVPVWKADKESIRICGDFKVTVNQASKLDRYPIPKIEDLFSGLAGGKTFSKLDMSQAYQQIPLAEESRKYVVINTHRGLFQYNRLPFGVSSAPGVFQRVMESLLQGVPHVVVYLDDILVTGPTDEEHLAALEEVFKRVQDAGLRLKREKCTFMASAVAYLGHKIDSQGLHPLPDKVRAVQEAPTPGNVTELKSYLGLLSYYSKFLPNLSTVLAPLYQLLRHNQKWEWRKPQATAFIDSKRLLLSSQVLVHFDPKLEIRLACDASNYGIGAVLSHIMPDGTEKPVGFVSRTLNDSEKKYSQIEKEALACVVGVTRFRSYLWGHHFTLQTDHKPLLSLFNENKAIPQQAANRIQRWAWTLASYEYTIEWRNTSQHANADALSRLPLPESPLHSNTPAELVLLVEQLQDAPITAKQIATWTKQDPLMTRVLRYVQHGWPSQSDDSLQPYWSRRTELSVEADCLLWGLRVVIPPQGRESVLSELHVGHPGVSRMKSLARGLVWWPGIDKSIEMMVKQCNSCQQNQSSPPHAPLQPWSWPTRPWSRLHVDYAGPVEGKMILIVIDAHSKWIEAIPLSTATAVSTVQQLRKIFSQFGLPDLIVSDNGTQFTATEFQEFCRLNGIRHTTIAPYHPSSNGLAERAVRIVKDGLKKLRSGTLMDRLSKILFRYRITPQTTTGTAPSELLFGRKLKSCLDLLRPNLRDRVENKQARQKIDHDRKARSRRFSPGDSIFIRNRAQGDKWLPGTIVTTSGPVSYRVQTPNGRMYRCHQDQIRPREYTAPSSQSGPEDDFDLVDIRVGNTPQELSSGSPHTVHEPDEVETSGSLVAPSAATAQPTLPGLPCRKTYPSRTRTQPDWYHNTYC